MKAQNLILVAVAIYAGVGEATLCWTNGLNLLMGGKPWGAGCSQLPVNPPPPPPPRKLGYDTLHNCNKFLTLK